MAKTKLNLVGSGVPAKALTLNPSKLINLMPIYSGLSSNTTHPTTLDGSKTVRALYATPGTAFYSTPPDTSVIRGVTVLNDILYFVAGSSVYSFDGSSYLYLGALTSSYGRVSIFTNATQVAILDGVAGYTYDTSTSTFAAISDGDFNKTALYGAFHKSRLVYVQPSSDKIWISDLNDFTSYNALNFATAEYDPMYSTTLLPINDMLYIFGRHRTELWQVVPDTVFPYLPVPGGVIDYGIVAPRSVVAINNVPIWLTQNQSGQALLVTASGSIAEVLTDEHASYQLSQMTDLTNAFAQTFQLDGHTYYKITFPGDHKSFLYDVKHKILFQWASWRVKGTDSNGISEYELGEHISDYIFLFKGQLRCTDYRSGLFLTLDGKTYTDYNTGINNTIYREVTTPIISDDRTRLLVDAIEVDCETGQTGQALQTFTETVDVTTYYLDYNGVRQYELTPISAPNTFYTQVGGQWWLWDFSTSPASNTIYIGLYPDTSTLLRPTIQVSGYTLETVTAGVPTTYQQLVDVEPILLIALSKDGGRTFPYQRQVSSGDKGDYIHRARLNKWGVVRDAAIKINTNHPGFVAINEIVLDVRKAST